MVTTLSRGESAKVPTNILTAPGAFSSHVLINLSMLVNDSYWKKKSRDLDNVLFKYKHQTQQQWFVNIIPYFFLI